MSKLLRVLRRSPSAGSFAVALHAHSEQAAPHSTLTAPPFSVSQPTALSAWLPNITGTAAAFPGATIVRPSVVFGPEDKFFNLFAGLARLSPVLPVVGCPAIPKVELFVPEGPVRIDIYGGGGPRFQPVYVGDVADAIMKILGDHDTAGKTYELGGPRTYSFKEIMELMLAEIGRRRILLPLPYAFARIEAWFLEKWPQPILTRDQVTLLEKDNVVAEGALTFQDLEMEPTAAEAILPTYLRRFRPSRLQGAR